MIILTKLLFWENEFSTSCDETKVHWKPRHLITPPRRMTTSLTDSPIRFDKANTVTLNNVPDKILRFRFFPRWGPYARRNVCDSGAEIPY